MDCMSNGATRHKRLSAAFSYELHVLRDETGAKKIEIMTR